MTRRVAIVISTLDVLLLALAMAVVLSSENLDTILLGDGLAAAACLLAVPLLHYWIDVPRCRRLDVPPPAAIEAAAEALCAWPSVRVDDRHHGTATHMATDALVAALPHLAEPLCRPARGAAVNTQEQHA